MKKKEFTLEEKVGLKVLKTWLNGDHCVVLCDIGGAFVLSAKGFRDKEEIKQFLWKCSRSIT